MDCPVRPGNDKEGLGNDREGLGKDKEGVGQCPSLFVILGPDPRIHGCPIQFSRYAGSYNAA